MISGIDGHTKLIAHLGVPTESFKAPMIYNPYFKKHAINAVVVPMGCEVDHYASFLSLLGKLRNFHGALVTMPHKVTTASLVDELSTTARVAGSCNAVLRLPDGRLRGDMFDGEGFVRGVMAKGRQLAGSRALLVGCGGVGCAIAASLAKAGAAELGLYDVNGASMHRLQRRLAEHYPALAIRVATNDPDGWDVVVNATPLGMIEGDPLPLDVTRLAPGCFVGEVVMKRDVTPFLAAAQARGCQTQVGLDMLFHMVPAYLEFFAFRTATPQELRDVAEFRD